MAEKHIYLVPTDGTADEFEAMVLGDRKPSPEEKAQMDKEWGAQVLPSRDRLQRARKFGVPIAMGSDMYLSIPHQTRGEASLNVLQAYADDGMPPMEVIQTATRNAAELLGLKERTGTLEVGKWADIIAVPGDPLKDISVLQHARFVMKGGIVIKNKQ
jgi:imidazolonepropionase-like amidohydrolase